MARFAKVAGWAAVFVLYVWFAAVRNADAVKRRKRARRRLDSRG
jgi:hypothetical protein